MLKEAEFGPNLLRHWIDRAAERDPDKAYIVSVDDRRTISYGQLRRLTRQIATFLAERGIRTNDRIALLAGNSIEHLACYIGVMAYGATICTIHVEMNRGHLAQILPTLNPRLAVFDAGLGLDDVLAKTSAPCLPLGSVRRRCRCRLLQVGCRLRADGHKSGEHAAAGRCLHLVHLRHQCPAERRGADISRAARQCRADRGRIGPDRRRSHL